MATGPTDKERIELDRMHASGASTFALAEERLVALSACFLLLLHHDADAEIEALIDEVGDAVEPARESASKDVPVWLSWRFLGSVPDEAFDESLTSIVEDLRARYGVTGHPLSLVPELFQILPREVLRSAIERVIDFLEFGENPPKDDILRILNFWGEKCGGSFVFSPLEGALPLATFLVDCLGVQKGQKCYVPYSGSWPLAALLVAAEHNVDLAFGNIREAAVATLRLLLITERSGRISVRVEMASAQSHPRGHYDIVLALPPWGGRQGTIPDDFAVRSPRSELVAVQHIVDSLAADGRAVILLPFGFFYRRGQDEMLRRHLIEHLRVDAVLELPGKTFAHQMSVRSSVLFIRKDLPRSNVWFLSESTFSHVGSIKSARSFGSRVLSTALRARLGVPLASFIGTMLTKDVNPAALDEMTLLFVAAAKGVFQEVRRNSKSTEEWFSPENERLMGMAVAFANGADAPTNGDHSLIAVNDIAQRNWELIWKDEGSTGLSTLLERLSHNPSVQLVRVEDLCASLIRGLSYRRDTVKLNLAPYVDNDGTVAVIRVSDLPKLKSQQRVVSGATYALDEKTTGSLHDRILLNGDVLISTSGTIGKTAIFAQKQFGDQKAVAANGVTVLRLANPAHAPFVASLLLSEPYQEALNGQSTGATIKHLRIDLLKALTIPLLPMAEQSRLGEVLRNGVSAQTILDSLAFGSGRSHATAFLLDSPELKTFASMPSDAPVGELKMQLAQVIAVTNVVTTELRNVDPYLGWFALFNQTARDLADILEMPSNGEKLAALMSCVASLSASDHGLRKAYSQLPLAPDQATTEIGSALRKRCEAMREKLVVLARGAARSILSSAAVTASVEPALVPVGRAASVALRLKNESEFALRTVSVKGDGIRPRAGVFFPRDSILEWELEFPALPPGKRIFSVEWRGVRLDGEPVQGTLELAVDALDVPSESPQPDMGPSPYVYARVLDETSENVFFGRSKAMEQLQQALEKRSGNTIILIEGNRRIGKTSLLRYFIRHRVPEGWLPVFINFQDFEGDTATTTRRGVPTQKVFEGIAKAIAGAFASSFPGSDFPGLGIAPSKAQIVPFSQFQRRAASRIEVTEPFASLRSLVDEFRHAIVPFRLLFLFDEFDRLQEGIESGVTSDQVPENLRHLFQKWNDLAAIFTGSRTIRRLRAEYFNVLFGLGETIRLGGLEQKEAEDLIESPVRGRLVYTPEAVAALSSMTARQPLLIQWMCDGLFQTCRDQRAQIVTLPMVEKAAEARTNDSEHFETIWGYVESDRQRLLVLIVDRLERELGAVTIEQMQEAAEQEGVRYSTSELRRDIDPLLDLEILTRQVADSAGQYRLEVPLFARWLRKNKDLSEIRGAALEE